VITEKTVLPESQTFELRKKPVKLKYAHMPRGGLKTCESIEAEATRTSARWLLVWGIATTLDDAWLLFGVAKPVQPPTDPKTPLLYCLIRLLGSI
jgi:hypothetical protein